jgi:hypothetical protein
VRNFQRILPKLTLFDKLSTVFAVPRNSGTVRMFGGGVRKWRRLVCLAWGSGASCYRLANCLPTETTAAVGAHYAPGQ